jgi:hypothetical protein
VAVNTALAAYPRILELRAEFEQLPIDWSTIEQIKTLAEAAGHAQALYTVATQPPEELQAVYEDALARRATLKSDAMNLALHNLVNRDAVNAVKNDVGYRNVGYDLMSLVTIFRSAGDRLIGRTATLPADVDRAEAIANQLLAMNARREERSSVDPQIAEDRQRAFTLLLRAYDQARRALEFLRWERGDADRIAPSLYAMMGGGRPRKKDGTTSTDLPSAPATTPPAPGAAAASNVSLGVDVPAAPPVAPGAQGGNPFVSAG